MNKREIVCGLLCGWLLGDLSSYIFHDALRIMFFLPLLSIVLIGSIHLTEDLNPWRK